MYWVNGWWTRIAEMPLIERRQFALSLIPRIVINHPFKDGNKRTSRLLTNVLSHKMNLARFRVGFFKTLNLGEVTNSASPI